MVTLSNVPKLITSTSFYPTSPVLSFGSAGGILYTYQRIIDVQRKGTCSCTKFSIFFVPAKR
jgi:hypothetical protein